MAFINNKSWYRFYPMDKLDELANDMVKENPSVCFYEGNTSIFGIVFSGEDPDNYRILVYRLADKGSVALGGATRQKVLMTSKNPSQLKKDIQNGIHFVTTPTK